MFKTALKITGEILLVVAEEVIFGSDNSQRNAEQLSQLNDGFGNIVAAGSDLTQAEADVAQNLGELYDTYL